MAQDVEGLLIQIEATTAGLRRELSVADQAVAKATGQIDSKLGQVDAAFDRVSDSARDAQSKINASMTGIASGITVALSGLAALTTHAADSAKELKNLSLVSNTSTSEFQRYAAGAKSVGIEQDKLADIFKDTNDKLGDFLQNGGGELQDFFKTIAPKVGLTAEAFKNLSGPQALQLYYTSLEKAGVNQQAMTFYMESIADEATALIPLLRNNGFGFKELGEQAQRAGKFLSDIQIDQLLEVGKAVDSLKLQVQGATNELVTGMAPGLLEVTQKLQGLTDNGAMKTLGEGIGFLVGNLDVLVALLGAKAASAFVGYTRQVMASVTATSESVAANIQQADSALQAAIANQKAAETARIRAAMEATAAKGTAVQTQMSIQLAEARMAEAAATNRVAAAQTALRAAQTGILSLLGGPAGIAALAIGAGVAFLTMGSNAKDSASDLNALKEPLDQISAKFKQLSKDQQGAQLAKLSLDQRDAAVAAAEAYQDFLDTVKQDIGGDMAGRLAAEFNAAREAGKPLSDVIDDIGRRMRLSPEAINSWKIAAGASNEADQSLQRVNTTISTLTNSTKENTAATQANNAARAGMSTAGNQYLGTLQKQLQGLQDNGDAIKTANRYIADNKDLTEADRVAILSAANAIESQKKANQAATQATKDSNKATSDAASTAKQQAKALEDLTTKASLQTKTASEITNAYLRGIDQLQKYTLQQQIEEALLKTGAAARDKVTAALTAEQNARDRQDLAKSYYDLKQETDQLIAQATATLKGTDALEAYNKEKTLSTLLAGKNADALGEERKKLEEIIDANQKAAKALEDARKVEGILDRLDPQAKAAKDYANEVEILNEAMARYPDRAAEYQEALRKLGLEYESNHRQATAWGQFTEGAIDRIDEAFADGWKNIDKGFKGFASGLLDSFKQLLAEMAHMAITKPIVMQISAAMGLGGLSGAANATSLLGGGGGGMDIMSLASSVQKLYGVATSGFGQAIASGWASGGFSGAISGGYSSLAGGIGALFGGGGAVGTATAGALTTGANGVATGLGYLGNGAVSFPGAAAGVASGASGLLGTGLSAGGAGLAGIGGALYGYGKSGLKGAATGAAGSIGGAMLGSLLLPGIGTLLGGALGGMIGGSLFGGKWTTKSGGINLGVSGGELDAQSYEYQKKKGGLFGKNKSRYRYDDLDAETAAALQTTYDATESNVLTLFKQLGIDGADALATSFNTGIRVNVQTSGKTEEEINQALTEWFGSIQENMVDVVNGIAGSPFQNLDFAGLQELAVDLTGVNSILNTLHRSTLDISVNGALAAKSLVDLAGGLDTLTANANTYYQNFFTEAERNENYLKDVRKQFEALGIAMPATRDAFRQTVDALDLTTTTGQQMFATLTALSGNAATAYSILEQQAAVAQQAMTDAANAAAEAAQAAAQAAAEAAAAAKQVLVDSVTSAFTALQRAITAEQQKLTDAYNARVASLNDMVSTANSNISTLTQLSGSLHNALQQLRGASDTSGMAYQSATAQLRKALSGGSLVGADLDDAISAVTGNTSDRYTNWQDFARDQGRSANLLEALESKTNGQLTTQEKTLATLEKQLAQAQTAYDAEMDRLQGQLDLAQAQIDAINGVDNTVLSVVDAVNRLHASIIALSPSGTGGMNADQLVKSTYKAVLGRDADASGLNYWKGQLSSGAVSSNDLASAIRGSANQNGELIRNLYQQILGRAPDAAGMSYWQNAVASGSVTDLIAAFKAAAASAGEIPGFARGGPFDGGARIVGESGPELEVTGPSRIYSHSETKNMFSNNNEDLIAEVRALRQEIASQTHLQSQITRNTAKTARYTQQMNEVGLPAMES